MPDDVRHGAPDPLAEAFAAVGVPAQIETPLGAVLADDDGSITIWFGPSAPEDREANWIQPTPA